MTVRTKTVQLPLLRCFAAILYKMPVWTEGRPRYFAALLQSMPAWTQHISRCFVASLQSYIRCQSELKAASAASLLRYNLCQPENKNLTLLRLRREVRLQERVWNDIMAFFVVLDSFELQMMAELIKRGRNDKMWRVVRLPFFGEWPPDDVFSFRCRSWVKGRRRKEEWTKKVGCFSTVYVINSYPTGSLMEELKLRIISCIVDHMLPGHHDVWNFVP